MQQREELKKTFLDMLEQDREFRHAVAGLIGYKEILDRIASVEERMAENQARNEERFLRVEEEIRNLRKDMQEGFRRHDEEFARVWKSIEDMRKDMQEGFKRHDEEIKSLRMDMQEGFKRHDEEIKSLRMDMQEGFKRHDEELVALRVVVASLSKGMDELSVSVGALGRRVGKDLERLILNIYRDQLMQLGIDKDKAKRFEYIDKEGLYGLKGKRYEFDIVVSDGYADVVEVKSRMSEEDIVVFYEKVNSIRPVIDGEYGRVRRLVAVAVHMDAEAIEKAKELGIECIYGHIIRD
ncbi:MAG: DUF3782 domain-containing protein [Candidatus Nitrosocaldus sp.]|nr:DUF3782 domain-containing protein [Candidatus Nitrosocaldus sp.]MDW8000501.1 DUF3782 domain-containing protein [Candidatus Nitrosocaldus sp.]